MPTILAALDASAALEPTARAARSLASLLDAEVLGVHVLEPDSPDPAALAARAGLQVRTITADEPAAGLVLAMQDPAVTLAVVGARDVPGQRAPIGHVARLLALTLDCPLLVVPPASKLGSQGRLRRALVPLDGDPTTSADVDETIALLTDHGVEVVVTHVFNTAHAPRFIDEPQHGYDAWREEFLARHEPRADRIELRRGPAWEGVMASARDIEADLVVLAWSQQLAPGHATVVREALANPSIPTLLLPHQVASGSGDDTTSLDLGDTAATRGHGVTSPGPA